VLLRRLRAGSTRAVEAAEGAEGACEAWRQRRQRAIERAIGCRAPRQKRAAPIELAIGAPRFWRGRGASLLPPSTLRAMQPAEGASGGWRAEGAEVAPLEARRAKGAEVVAVVPPPLPSRASLRSLRSPCFQRHLRSLHVLNPKAWAPCTGASTGGSHRAVKRGEGG